MQSGTKGLGVVVDVVLNKGADKVVSMIISFLEADLELVRNAELLDVVDESVGVQVLLQEAVVGALVDQNLDILAEQILGDVVLQQMSHIVVVPDGGIMGAQVLGHSEQSPRRGRGRENGGKGRDGLVGILVLQEDGQGAVATHGVTQDGRARSVLDIFSNGWIMIQLLVRDGPPKTNSVVA